MLDSLHYEDYAAQSGTKFELPDANGEIELIEATKKDGGPQQEMFSLLFRGPKERFFQQGIYRMRHAALGEGELFLVPVAQTADGFHYEASFNRLVPTGA